MPEFVTLQPEAWPDDASRTAWRRNASGRFEMESTDGQPPHPSWNRSELTAALGCPQSIDAADGGSRSEPAFFPPSFVHSPATGRMLDRPQTSEAQIWLPPNGNQDLTGGLVRGGKLTRASLLLRDAGPPLPAPPLEIKLPQQGRYRFLRACCGLRKAYLLALEPCAGMLFCLLPGRNEWTKLTPRAGHNTTTCSDGLPYAVWNVEALDLTGGTILIWPSDSGLLALRPNLVSMTYDVELLAPGRCVSPVLPVAKRFAVLTEHAGSVSLVAAGIEGKPETLVSGVPHSNWISAAASPLDSVWISEEGHVVASVARNQFEFIPWSPPTVEPLLRYGPPYYAADTRLWQQVLHPTASDGDQGLCFVPLGRRTEDLHLSPTARFLTGQSSIEIEQRLEGEPWNEIRVAPGCHQLDEAVVPILESVTDKSLLVLRVDHKEGPESFLNNRGAYLTRFQVFEQHDDNRGFYSFRLTEPWIASAFIHEGALFIYHPDLPSIPGWPLKNS